MPSIENPITEALNSRLLGACTFDSGVSSLDAALTLQSKIHYHLFGQNLNSALAQSLSDECASIWGNGKIALADEDVLLMNLLNKILYNCQGILLYHTERANDASIYFSKAKIIEIRDTDFSTFLDLENLYYRGLSSGAAFVYEEELFKITDKIPKDSQGLTLHYLSMIFNHMARDKQVAIRILSKFPPENPLTCLASLHLEEYDDDKYLSILKKLVDQSQFPPADGDNSVQLEQFHLFLHYYFKKSTKLSKEWSKYLIASMEKTFQSVPVAKSAFIYFGKTSLKSQWDKRESILNFVNFVKYSQRNYILNGKKYDDLISIIDSYAYILKIAQNNSSDIESVFNFRKTIDTLLELLHLMHQQNKFPLMLKSDAVDWLENSDHLVLPRTVSKGLTNAWEILYTFGKDSLQLLNDNSLISYLSNALCVATDPLKLCNLQFQYAYVLAQQRHIEPAVKILKTVLLEENPECYKAWHLLALCQSVSEDKRAAFKIVCSVLQAMQESLSEEGLCSLDRWQFVHLKMTQLRIVEDIFGTMDALEMLPELFELYSTLFPAETKLYDRIGDGYNDTKQYLLQLVWIFAASLYFQIPENYEDAKGAINEAARVSKEFKNLNCNIARGYLYLAEKQSKKAAKEFNIVLLGDRYNVNALVGLAKVIFPEEKNETYDYYKLRPPTPESLDSAKKADSVFVSEADKSANVARLKLSLESAVSNSVEAHYSPEVWWYLSILYEQYKDLGYKDTLLKCIRYKETEPVREFKYCDF
ncbi:YPP1 (YGR198W) [Zygosaccharomyces parabailii]|uniref:Cargo-transport protein YPP1 n=1 Tax=Zygosaccharomyces bailii (strain CLIB 213 / ATCC 58445 / CBS 680 / BCRC 21525 / NBRC 1098 / NCYC 1416 / NRRL Y-2227) TaxID=1333698 RepID=A0A8J2X841_ZYGB2|nr:YPP1 (YGR198W) [Zygosaccharomyces parabailii]CDF87468.1 BN860_07052g1_1 [Zygosaccharomyces bailii CLIB 213]CDH09384.1 related to Putative protein kinase involved in signaling [Zygosaccharomyces bailii ISA1307]SJM85173.1 related to Cargo-transport protein YPP1 [Zygosaccharomyces bailii]